MLVVDTSAVLAALAGRPPDLKLVERLVEDGDLHAPHLIDVELIHALRRLVSSRAISLDRAADVRSDFSDLLIARYPHEPLADRMWEMRDSFSAYDAAFVTLSEAIGAPLITCDSRLAKVRGHRARIEVFSSRNPTRG